METVYIRKILAWGMVALAVAIVVFASLYELSEAPAIWLDEGLYSQLGLNIAQTGQNAFQVAPAEFVHSSYISVGYPLLYPLAFSYKLFGAGVVQGRGVMVVFILLFVAASYWLSRRLFGPSVAAWSLLVLVSFAELYGNGKSILGEVPGLLYLVVALIGLSYLEQSNYKKTGWYAATGFFAGLCIATKPIFILFLGALFFAWLLRFKGTPLTLRGFVVGLVALLVPFGFWIYTQFGGDVTFASLLHDYANPYSSSDTQIVAPTALLQNLKHFVTEITPMYTALVTLVWAIALWIRRKMRISSVEWSAFFFCVLIILAYIRLPGWYRYLFPATTVALVFLPPSALAVFAYIKEKLPLLAKVAWVPYAALALMICGQLYQVFFSSYVADYYQSTRTRDTTAFFAGLPENSRIFLFNVPELAVLLPTRNYYQYVKISPVVTIGSDQLAGLRNGIPDFVVITGSEEASSTALFTKYQPFKTINRYEILRKSP